MKAFREADKVAKLTALATSSNVHEAKAARAKALSIVADIDVEYLDVLAEQRSKLREDIRTENRRLRKRNSRPNAHTRDLMDRASILLGHYERADALPSVVKLLGGGSDAV